MQHFRRQISMWSTLILLPAFLVGCGGSANEMTTTAVSGKVTFEDGPISGGGEIRFIPAQGKAAAGTIGSDGTYKLSTYGVDDGAILGEHRVEISQYLVLQEAKYASLPEGATTEDEAASQPVKEEVRVADEDLIPEVYDSVESPLRATVTVDGENVFDFTLERTP